MTQTQTRNVLSCLSHFHSSVSLTRSQEEVSALRRKLERHKSREWASSSDEILLEEIKTYKVGGAAPIVCSR